MCNAMVKETHGGLSDSIGRGGGEMERGASAYVLSTSSQTIMQMWGETGEGKINVASKSLEQPDQIGGIISFYI